MYVNNLFVFGVFSTYLQLNIKAVVLKDNTTPTENKTGWISKLRSCRKVIDLGVSMRDYVN